MNELNPWEDIVGKIIEIKADTPRGYYRYVRSNSFYLRYTIMLETQNGPILFDSKTEVFKNRRNQIYRFRGKRNTFIKNIDKCVFNSDDFILGDYCRVELGQHIMIKTRLKTDDEKGKRYHYTRLMAAETYF